MKRLLLYLLPVLMVFASCGKKAEPVEILRFEQFLFNHEGNAADFDTPLLNYHPDDPAFMAMLNDFVSDPIVHRVYEITDSLYHDLSWLEQDLGDAMKKAHELCPEVSYRFYYTLITADFGNYANRVFSNGTDMVISIDNYTLGEVAEMQMFGVPTYIMNLCTREHILPDCMAAAAREHIELPDGDLTFLDHAIAEGKTLYFLDKIRYTKEQMDWMEENLENVWGWLIQNDMLFSADLTKMRNLLDDAPKTNAFGEGSAPRTGNYIGWQIVKQYMKKSGSTMSELFKETDSRKILTESGWRP